jgi:hypothetical protein
MKPAADSFHTWLSSLIHRAIKVSGPHLPLLFWCDPHREWSQLLRLVAIDGGFELWADEVHELKLRERLHRSTHAPRVIWLPAGRADIGFCEVYALQAADVREIRLAAALDEYGVDLPSDDLRELEPLLGSYAEERFDYPKSSWKDLTLGQAESTLVDASTILDYLADLRRDWADLVKEGRFGLFSRIAARDFGLSAPDISSPDAWRTQALARLLCTEASVLNPGDPPSETDRTIPAGPARDNALGLINEWLRRIDLIDNFEELAPKAESLTGLRFWARDRTVAAPVLSSQVVEETLFRQEADRLEALQDFQSLARALSAQKPDYERHALGYWGKLATHRIPWRELADLAGHAEVLDRIGSGVKDWQTPPEAVRWYTLEGWTADASGEALFREAPDLPGPLVAIRARLQRAYLRFLDSVNRSFSETVARHGVSLNLPFAGDVIKKHVEQASPRNPIAVLILDACRYELGQRLAGLLNEGEPATRAAVDVAMAPLPSITALGMAFSLPGLPPQLTVAMEAGQWRVLAAGFLGNLSQAAQRREWLGQRFKLKEHAVLAVADVLNQGPEVLSAKALGRLVFVFGDELDSDGHEGRLKITGSGYHLDRYAKVVRKLRSAGYPTVLIVTDHGFFHWTPDADEIERKPDGDIVWTSRRAVVGHGLHSTSALPLKVSASDLDCAVPRSVNAFQTYGGLGYFHGGATLQELIIPVVTVAWPRKSQKIGAVLKPVDHIERQIQKIEVAPASVQQDLAGGVDESLVSRSVAAKAIDPSTGKTLFKSDAATIEPGGGTVPLTLKRVPGAQGRFGSELQLQLLDADDDELLESQTVRLSVELDEWD